MMTANKTYFVEIWKQYENGKCSTPSLRDFDTPKKSSEFFAKLKMNYDMWRKAKQLAYTLHCSLCKNIDGKVTRYANKEIV